MGNVRSTKTSTDTQTEQVFNVLQLKEAMGEVEYNNYVRHILLTEFIVERMDELGFDCPDDVPLHLSLDYHLVLLQKMIEQANKEKRALPDMSKAKLRESLV